MKRVFLLYQRKPKTRPAGGISKAKALIRRLGKAHVVKV